VEVWDLAGRLAGATTRLLRRRRERVMLAARSPAFRTPWEFYRRRSQDTDRLRERLEAAGDRLVDRGRLQWRAVTGRLDALSPLAVLDRGYAIVRREDGAVVRGSGDVEKGDPVSVRLGRGGISCIVEGRSEDSPETLPAEKGEGR
jgi:exodeoxyribonuclease VII large subunit